MKRLLVLGLGLVSGCAAQVAKVTPTMTPDQITDAINQAIAAVKPAPPNYKGLVLLIAAVVIITLVISKNSAAVLTWLNSVVGKVVAAIKAKL